MQQFDLFPETLFLPKKRDGISRPGDLDRQFGRAAAMIGFNTGGGFHYWPGPCVCPRCITDHPKWHFGRNLT